MNATTAASTDITDVKAYCENLAQRALDASRELGCCPNAQRTAALLAIARRLVDSTAHLEQENARDLAAGQKAGLSAAMLDRLKLDARRISAMAQSVQQIAAQIDPVGQVITGYVRPSGIRLQKVRVPLGVVLIIYESRPNVTSDAAALCIRSGNAVILRGGKEALHSNAAIATCVRDGLADAGRDPDVVQLVQTTDRAAVGHLLAMEGKIDVAIPRGGESLIRAVVEQARIPVIKHYTGNCHVYVDEICDEKMALDICINAKTQRPGVCNAAESLLFHAATLQSGLMTRVLKELADRKVQIRGDERVRAAFPSAVAATEPDWGAEYLDLIVAVKVVDSLDEAIAHINRYGSRHTDAIVTREVSRAQRFIDRVDSANVFVNCSTRFSDGGEYGLGAEIGISTDKLHSRGPMGAEDLTTYKWVAFGDGQTRG